MRTIVIGCALLCGAAAHAASIPPNITAGDLPAQQVAATAAAGMTAASRDSMPAGDHRLDLALAGYDQAREGVTLLAAGTMARPYALTYPSPWGGAARDGGGDALRQSEPRRKNPWPKILLATGAVGCGVAGIVFNVRTQDQIDKDAALKDEYSNIYGDARYHEYEQRLAANKAEAYKSRLVRNILYGAAGLFAVGFGVSFAF